MKRRRILQMLMTLVLVFALVACSGDDEKAETEDTEVTETDTDEEEEETEDTDADAEDSSEMDEEQIAYNYHADEPTTMNSAAGSDNSSNNIITNIFEPLVRRKDDGEGGFTVEPAAAESWEVSEDGTTYTFTIRDGMTWTNGDPVTAHDFEFGIKSSLDSERGAGGSGFLIDCIKGASESIAGEPGESDNVGVTALDDHTLEIEIEEPLGYFLQVLTDRPAMPMHKESFEEHGEEYGSAPDKFVSNGPFTMVSWTPNSELIFEKNEDYWDAENVHYTEISWRIINEEMTIMNAFMNKELDSAATSKPEWIEKFDEDDTVVKDVVENPQVAFMFMNTEEKPYNNAKVRRAISMAIDRDEAIEAVYNGAGTAASGWVVPATALNDEPYREIVGDVVKEVQDEVEDPQALLVEGLEEEGMTLDEFKIVLSFGGTSERHTEIGDYYISVFENNLGVQVEPKLNEWSAFVDIINDGQYEVGYMVWGAHYGDPYCMLSLMMSDNGSIPTFWKSEEYDNLVREARGEADADNQAELYHEAEKLLIEESAVVPLQFTESYVYHQDYVKEYSVQPFDTEGYRFMYNSGKSSQ